MTEKIAFRFYLLNVSMPLKRRQRGTRFLSSGDHPKCLQFIFVLVLTKSLGLQQAGNFLEEHISLGNHSKSTKSFLESPHHQGETLRRNI